MAYTSAAIFRNTYKCLRNWSWICLLDNHKSCDRYNSECSDPV